MSREILYKGKYTENGEWIEGYYVKLLLTGSAFIFPGDVSVEPCKKGVLLFKKYQVDPETVCQYTGFNDIQANKAFEHSIVFYEDTGIYGKIVFEDGQYKIKWQSGHDDLREDMCFWFTQRRIHIVGNIFDDLELLEEEG